MSGRSSSIAKDGPHPTRCCETAQQSARGRLKIFLGAAPGVGKTYEMLSAAPARATRRRRCRRRRGRDPRPARNRGAARRASRSFPRQRVEYKGRMLAEMDLDAILAAPPAAGAGRRAGAHQRAGQPPSQALHGRRGAARRRHRRLHHAQHPARRKPERRGRPDHPHPGARDGAGFDHRPGRRHRADRPDAGRPDPAPEGRQGLCAAPGRARDPPLLLARQPDRAARTGAAPHRAAGRRPDGRLYAAHAIAGPWAAGERVLVCVSGDPSSADVVRHAKRLADQPAGALDRDPCRDRRAT